MDKKRILVLARILNIAGNIWLALALAAILIGYIGIVIGEDTIWHGVKKLISILSPFNISNYIAIFLTLVPGIIMKTLANRIKKKHGISLDGDADLRNGEAIDVSALQDVIAVPEKEMEIIGDYGKTLEELGEVESNKLLKPLSKLPHPKQKIEVTLRKAIGIVKDEKFKLHLERALVFLEDFIPDNEIPEDPDEHLRLWLSRKDWKNPAIRENFADIMTRIFIEKYGDEAPQKTKEFHNDLMISSNTTKKTS